MRKQTIKKMVAAVVLAVLIVGGVSAMDQNTNKDKEITRSEQLEGRRGSRD